MSSAQVIHRSEFAPRPRISRVWENYRNRPGVHYVLELIAEATGGFVFAFPGIGATASFVVSSIFKQSGVSSIFQIGCCYGMGIALAISICGATSSGGHFHPAITISLSVLNRFPRWKAPGYIFAQIFGVYFAAILVYYQWEPLIVAAEAALKEANVYNQVQFTPGGPAGIFAFYLPPGQTYWRVFLNEFMTAAFVGLPIWACLDPSNVRFPPAAVPFILGFAYATAIWGCAEAGIALNTARDVGGRLMAITIWGKEAAGGRYAAIAALTNIVATLIAFFAYEFFFVDSDRAVPNAQLELARVTTNHKRPGRVHARHLKNPKDDWINLTVDESGKGHATFSEHSIRPWDAMV